LTMLTRHILSCQRGGQPRLLHPICLVWLSSMLFSSIHAATAQTSRPTFEVATVKPAFPQADPNTGTPIEFAIVNTSRLTRTGYDHLAHEIQCERD
jgi:hypothetical protein